MSEERAKRSMSTTFKDGLRERMADRADENGAHCVAAAIRGERPANLLYTKDAVLVAAAALAYCDQWEEVEGGWADTHSPRSGRGIILVRKAPVPTVDIEKAKREIKKLREDVILRKLCVEARIREALEALGEKEDR